MKIVYSEDHRLHAGAMEMINGEMLPMFEKPERMDMILKRIADLGFGEMLEPESFDGSPSEATRAGRKALVPFTHVANTGHCKRPSTASRTAKAILS